MQRKINPLKIKFVTDIAARLVELDESLAWCQSPRDVAAEAAQEWHLISTDTTRLIVRIVKVRDGWQVQNADHAYSGNGRGTIYTALQAAKDIEKLACVRELIRDELNVRYIQ